MHVFSEGYHLPADTVWCRSRLSGEVTRPHADMYYFQTNASLFESVNTTSTIASSDHLVSITRVVSATSVDLCN